MSHITQGRMNIREIRGAMNVIRRSGGAVQTNYYNQCSREPAALTCWRTERALAFAWPDNGITRIYFYATDDAALATVISCAEPNSVIDFITKDKKKSAELFAQAGYRMHLEYGRFCIEPREKRTSEALRTQDQSITDALGIRDNSMVDVSEIRDTLHEDETISQDIFGAAYGERAEVSDAEEIDRHLREEFDPYEAHFYSIEKLREHIRKGWVWVAKQDGKIVAADIFEIQGCKAYGAYLYNRSEVNVLCSLIAKVDEYVVSLGITYSYCWMRLSNKRIIRYNMKYNGYVPDGLYDIIYVKE